MSGDRLVHEMGEALGRIKLANTAKLSPFGLEYQECDDMWRMAGGFNSYLGRGSYGFIGGTKVLCYFLCLGLKVAFRHIYQNSLHKRMWPRSRMQSEYLSVLPEAATL